MSNAVTATGILIRRAPLATPTVFETIAEITDVDPGGKSRNKIDTSTHNEGTESSVLGIVRQGDPTFKVNFLGTEATHVICNDDFDGNVKAQWQILYPSGLSRTGPGRISQLKFHPAGLDSKQGADLAIAWAGPVVEVFEPAA
jgi:hypothetical protein